MTINTAPFFDGAASILDLFSPGLAARFNGGEGTALLAEKVADPGVWTDGQNRIGFYLGMDSGDYIQAYKPFTANQFSGVYQGSGFQNNLDVTPISIPGWSIWVLRWSFSSGTVSIWRDGAMQGAEQTMGGLCAGTLNAAYLGALAGPSAAWLGQLQHFALWSVALTNAEIAGLGTIIADFEGALKATEAASLIGYWPLNDLLGATAVDESGGGLDGIFNSVTLGTVGMGDDRPALEGGARAIVTTRPHQPRLFLSIYQPPTALGAQVNWTGTMAGLRDVPFDNVSVGAGTSVESGMTLAVGTAPGLDDMGTVRVRGISGSVLSLAENNHIAWADDLYLTVLRFWEIWPVYPRYVQNGMNVTFYKDYDIPYMGQNSAFGTFVNMGTHAAAFLDSGTGTLYYSARDTEDLFGRTLEYDWAFEGGTPTGSTDRIPGFVSYTGTGHFTTRLTVHPVGTNVYEQSYRHISIYDRLNAGIHTPFVQWSFSSDLSGSRANGGWEAKIGLIGESNRQAIRDGALVVIWSEDEYGGKPISIGGNAPGRENIFFVGYVKAGSITWNAHTSITEFDVVGPHEMMKNREAFSVSVQSMASPSDWDQILDMDVRRALYHYYRWHSTVLLTTDFGFVGPDWPVQYFDASRESLYDAGNTLMSAGLQGALVSDRQGKLWAERDVGAIHNATGTLPIASDIFKGDWLNTLQLTETPLNVTSHLEMGGVAYSGPETGTYSEHLSQAPGDAPTYSGKLETSEGNILQGQAQLDELVGDVLAHKNSRYPALAVEFSGNYRYIDIAPQRALLLTVLKDDTDRGVEWNRKPMVITDQSWTYAPEWEVLTTKGTLAEVTAGQPGFSEPIPPVPPDQQYALPKLEIPPLPSFLWPDTSPQVVADWFPGAALDDGPGVTFKNAQWSAIDAGGVGVLLYEKPAMWLLGYGGIFVPPITGWYIITVWIESWSGGTLWLDLNPVAPPPPPGGVSGNFGVVPAGTDYPLMAGLMQCFANVAYCMWGYHATGHDITTYVHLKIALVATET